jgi:hypothetical protein
MVRTWSTYATARAAILRNLQCAGSTNMCFAPPKERACHSHNSVEMTPFRESVLGTVFGKAAFCDRSSLPAVDRFSR